VISNEKKIYKYYKFLYWWYIDKNRIKKLKKICNDRKWNNVAIYGMGPIGELIMKSFQDAGVEVMYGIDRNPDTIFFDIDIYTLEEELPKTDAIIITPFVYEKEIKEQLASKVSGDLIVVTELL